MLLHLVRDEPLGERDPLTGALGRDAFTVRLLDEQNRAERTHSPLAVALVDVDYLKSINDTRGHAAGDRVLVAIADTLRRGRRSDLVARWGGDEFAIAFPDTALTEAARRLRRSLQLLRGKSPDKDGAGTFSAGVTHLDQHTAIEVAMGRADRGLYRAKRTGRGRVVICR